MDTFLAGAGVDSSLRKVFGAICASVEQVREALKTGCTKKTGGQNASGDHQLTVDVIADEICFAEMKKSGVVSTASSEETVEEVAMGGSGYSVAFDPLDGSSIIDCNFAVGSIFAVFKGEGFVGRCGDDQAASACAIYGPRTTLMCALPGRSTADGAPRAFEATLHGSKWLVTRASLTVKEGKVFAPGNLRATTELPSYRKLVDFWMTERYTLRYSGGMVPDCVHMLVKGKGVFCAPPSPSAPAKLRLLYEVAPMCLLLECAGGASCDGEGNSVMARKLDTTNDRTGVCLGSVGEVERYIKFMGQAKA